MTWQLVWQAASISGQKAQVSGQVAGAHGSPGPKCLNLGQTARHTDIPGVV